MLDAVKGNRHAVRDRAILRLLYTYGLRVSELTSMPLTAFRDGGRHRASRLRLERLKGGKSDWRDISGHALRDLRAWIRQRQSDAVTCEALFISQQGKALERDTISKMVEKAGRKALGRTVRPHQLRHACGYHLANLDKPAYYIRDWLGHQDVASTYQYIADNTARFDGGCRDFE